MKNARLDEREELLAELMDAHLEFVSRVFRAMLRGGGSAEALPVGGLVHPVAVSPAPVAPEAIDGAEGCGQVAEDAPNSAAGTLRSASVGSSSVAATEACAGERPRRARNQSAAPASAVAAAPGGEGEIPPVSPTQRGVAEEAVREGTAVPAAVLSGLTVDTSDANYLLARAVAEERLTALLSEKSAFDPFVMASVESQAGRAEAKAAGYRTFRVRREGEARAGGEVVCPGSREAGKKLTCAQCRYCDGAGSGRRGDVVVLAHGPGTFSIAERRREKRAEVGREAWTLPVWKGGAIPEPGETAAAYVEGCVRERLPIETARLAPLLEVTEAEARRWLSATLENLRKPEKIQRF